MQNPEPLRAGGLASGIDTNALVEQLTALQRRPIENLQRRQTSFKIQLSAIGQLKSRLTALGDATQALADGGVLGTSTPDDATGFKVESSSSSPVGTYAVQVNQLAKAAKARSTGFTDEFAQVTGGTLTIAVDGTNYDITIVDGETLRDVVAKINQSGAPVSATTINDGTSTTLSLTTKQTGYTIGDVPSSALTVTESSTGSLGQPLGITVTEQAQNAQFTVDGLAIERRSNTVSDVTAGTTLTLTAPTTAPETLVLNRDIDATAENLQTFVDAYNAVMEIVGGDLNIDSDTDRERSLAGDPSVRMLQRRLQSLVTAEVTEAGTNVRTLADIGIKSDRQGNLSLDKSALTAALSRDETAVDAIFSGATTGIALQMDGLVTLQTDSTDGLLTQREDGLNDTIERMDLDIGLMEVRVEKFQQTLYAKFVAMEEAISRLNATSSFLAQLKFPTVSSGGSGS